MSQPTNATAAQITTEVGRLQLLIRSMLAGMRTAIPVQVISCTNSGGVSAIGTVTVQPLVSAVDGSGTVWAHGQISGVPYMRIQGGANAVIIDPQPGDIGIAVVCDRDISGVIAAQGPAAPGSNRRSDLSDMVYLQSIIGAAPTQYIEFNSSGITINGTALNINCPVNFGSTMKHGGHVIDSTHTHSGVTTGPGTTGPVNT